MWPPLAPVESWLCLFWYKHTAVLHILHNNTAAVGVWGCSEPLTLTPRERSRPSDQAFLNYCCHLVEGYQIHLMVSFFLFGVFNAHLKISTLFLVVKTCSDVCAGYGIVEFGAVPHPTSACLHTLWPKHLCLSKLQPSQRSKWCQRGG